jgi:hypothetical protein
MGLVYWGKIALKLCQYRALAPIVPEINNIVGKHYADMLYPDENGCYEELAVDDFNRALAGLAE